MYTTIPKFISCLLEYSSSKSIPHFLHILMYSKMAVHHQACWPSLASQSENLWTSRYREAQDQSGDGCLKVVLHSTKQREMHLSPNDAAVPLPIWWLFLGIILAYCFWLSLIVTVFVAFKNCLKTQDIKAVDFPDVTWVPKLLACSTAQILKVQKYLPSPHLTHAPVWNIIEIAKCERT
jgi:hypothetical protein